VTGGDSVESDKVGTEVVSWLRDYFDLLESGWAVSPDGSGDEPAWRDFIEGHVAHDGLQVDVTRVWDGDAHIPQEAPLWIWLAVLRLPDGSKPPESPRRTAGQRRELRKRLRAGWGERLSSARRRLKRQLDELEPGWAARYRPHD
jgi:hypothetical protein